MCVCVCVCVFVRREGGRALVCVHYLCVAGDVCSISVSGHPLALSVCMLRARPLRLSFCWLISTRDLCMCATWHGGRR